MYQRQLLTKIMKVNPYTTTITNASFIISNNNATPAATVTNTLFSSVESDTKQITVTAEGLDHHDNTNNSLPYTVNPLQQDKYSMMKEKQQRLQGNSHERNFISAASSTETDRSTTTTETVVDSRKPKFDTFFGLQGWQMQALMMVPSFFVPDSSKIGTGIGKEHETIRQNGNEEGPTSKRDLKFDTFFGLQPWQMRALMWIPSFFVPES